MRLNWRRGLSRSLLLLALAGVGYVGLQWPSRLPELNCWSRFAKWPDGQPFSVFDLFEEANTSGNVEANKKRDAWSAESIVTRNQWVVLTRQKLIACETGGVVAPELLGQTNSVWSNLRNSLLGLLLPPLAILLGAWIVRGFRPSRAQVS